MMNFLKGKKSYIIAGLMVLIGLVKVFTGEAGALDGLIENAQLLLNGVGFATVRAGIAKVAG